MKHDRLTSLGDKGSSAIDHYWHWYHLPQRRMIFYLEARLHYIYVGAVYHLTIAAMDMSSYYVKEFLL